MVIKLGQASSSNLDVQVPGERLGQMAGLLDRVANTCGFIQRSVQGHEAIAWLRPGSGTGPRKLPQQSGSCPEEQAATVGGLGRASGARRAGGFKCELYRALPSISKYNRCRKSGGRAVTRGSGRRRAGARPGRWSGGARAGL